MPGDSTPSPRVGGPGAVDDGRRPVRRAYRPLRDPTVLVLALIALTAVAALLLGVGTGGGDGGGGGGPLFDVDWFRDDGDDDRRRFPLSVDVNGTDVQVGDAVAITVLGPDGDPVPNATVSVGGRDYVTGADGTVVHEFRDGGRHRIDADKVSNDSVLYVAGGTSIRVDRIVVELAVRTNVSRATVGDPVAVRVTGPDGEPVEATVLAGDRTTGTGADGIAVVTFRRAGNYTVDARRGRTNTTRYATTPTEVTVDRRPVGLSVAVNDSTVLVGEPVELTVIRRDTGEAINASVGVGGRQRWTGEDGRLVASFPRPGTATVTAAARSTPAVRFVPVARLVPVERRVVELELSVSDRRPDRGDTFEVTLRRADTGTPVDGEIRAGGEVYPTGEDGVVEVSLRRPGTVVVRGHRDATVAERFDPAYESVSVRGPYFRVSDVDAPGEAVAGGNVTVNATVENRGNEPGVATVTVAVANGSATRNRTPTRGEVRLRPGERGWTAPTLALPETPGTYRVTVDAGGDDRATVVVTVRNRTGSTATLLVGRAGSDRDGSPDRDAGPGRAWDDESPEPDAGSGRAWDDESPELDADPREVWDAAT